MLYPFELFWVNGDSAGDYRTEADALQAVVAMIERGGAKSAVDELVLAKVEENGDVIRLAEGQELAASAKRTAASMRRTA
ncbi:MAG: hypothetical protein ACYDAG_06665 [Chloroflexota bacterium]